MARAGTMAALLVAVIAATARGDGAFPDSLGILLPADDPDRVIVATNFGLIATGDGGQTWTWSCEPHPTGVTNRYQLGPPPLDRLFAVADTGLVHSDDRACSWTAATGTFDLRAAGDYFPDPVNPNRVLAVLSPPALGGSYTVVESHDGGDTFDASRFASAPGDVVAGVEIARSDPQVVYLALTSGAASAPELAVTRDGGAHWRTIDLSSDLAAALPGARGLGIIAVDPDDADKLFLRVSAASGEAFAISADGGAHVTVPLTVPGGILTSFVRTAAGTFLLAGVDGVRNVVFRSTDGGATFTERDAPRLRGLARRGGRLFGAADNDADGFALGESLDDGQSWQPAMSYDQVRAIQGCLKTACQADCAAKADLGLWPAAMCSADDGTAAAGATGAGGAAQPDADGAAPPEGGTARPPAGAGGAAGCACDDAGARGAALRSQLTVAALVGLSLAAALARRRRARRRNSEVAEEGS
jgi:hypothetical protein